MPTVGRAGARVRSQKLLTCSLDFRWVGRPGAMSEGSRARGPVLAKSVGAFTASHSANTRAGASRLFAKRPRAGFVCPGLLRGVEEKGRGRAQMGRATEGLRGASVMLFPRNLPAKPRAGVAVRPEMSKFYCDGLTTSERRRARARAGRSWPLICFLSLRARRAGGNRTKGNFTARLFVLH